MSFAVISDIHANLEALARAHAYIKNRTDIEEIIIGGDIIGYGANPNECIKLCRRISDNIILGNHDKAAVDPKLRTFFNVFAAKSAQWTEETLKEEYFMFLKSLPLTISRKKFLFVHATPHEPERWSYIFNQCDAKFQFHEFDQNICFIGHSHIPAVFAEKGSVEKKEGKYFLSQNMKYIVNVGSVGQPRDHNPKLSFVVFNEEEWTVEYIRIDYNIKKAADKILKAGLPSVLAERLHRGH